MRLRLRPSAVWLLDATLVLGCAASAEGQRDVGAVLQKIGAYVEQYYSRAQSFVATETVILQTLRSDLVAEGFARRLNFELRVDWTPRVDGERPRATMVRQLLAVNGRKPKAKDEPQCLDPTSEQLEPMSMLLPELQSDHTFSWSGVAKIDGRRVAKIDFRETMAQVASVEWKKDCMSVKVDGRSVGRVWADPESGEVLRLDVSLKGMVDFPVPAERQREWGTLKTLERSDISVRYRPVTFRDPEETVLLPRSIESAWAWRGGPSSRYRNTQSFSNYRRFVGEGRVVDSVGAAVPDGADVPDGTSVR
jgi:hypothetical protein